MQTVSTRPVLVNFSDGVERVPNGRGAIKVATPSGNPTGHGGCA
jgi:hypothetical protein